MQPKLQQDPYRLLARKYILDHCKHGKRREELFSCQLLNVKNQTYLYLPTFPLNSFRFLRFLLESPFCLCNKPFLIFYLPSRDKTPVYFQSFLENLMRSQRKTRYHYLEEVGEVGKVLFEWFSNNFSKANADKCHLILSTDKPFSVNIDNELIKNSNNKKLLGINLNNRLAFDTHVANTCNRVSKKLHALARFSQYMNIHKRRMTMKASIASEFGYCPLVGMFHSRKLDSRENKLNERALRIVYQDYASYFLNSLRKITRQL